MLRSLIGDSEEQVRLPRGRAIKAARQTGAAPKEGDRRTVTALPVESVATTTIFVFSERRVPIARRMARRAFLVSTSLSGSTTHITRGTRMLRSLRTA